MLRSRLPNIVAAGMVFAYFCKNINENKKMNCKKYASLIIVMLTIMLVTNEAQVKNIAHRGGSKLAPENTLAAFKNAVKLKADYFELDVYLCKDDSLVIMHDSKVSRTTNGKGSVDSLTYSDLRKLDAGGKFSQVFAGEKIPTLYESLSIAKLDKDSIGIVIELKSNDERLVPRVVKLVREMKLSNRVIISSFYQGLIEKVKKIAADIPTQVFGASNTSEIIDKLSEAKVNWYGTGKAPSLEFIRYVHSKGMKLNVWTINDEEKMSAYIKMGVDAITTDNPELMKKVQPNLH